MPDTLIHTEGGISHIATGKRTGSSIFLKGIHLWYEFKNKSEQDLELNFCVLQTKDGELQTKADLLIEFFRNPTGGQALVADYEELVKNSAYQPLYKHFALNQDKFYILYRHKKLVGRAEAVTRESDPVPPDTAIWNNEKGYGESKSVHKINKWIPYNKVVNFETTDDIMNHPIYILWWWSATDIDSHEYIGSLPVATYNGYTKAYFKDM